MSTFDDDAPVRVETYRTRDGRPFTIRRKSRPSKRFQKPRITGEMVQCPFCEDLHNVLEYGVRNGKKGERKVRTWRCPKTGTLSLNMGQRFQSYIDSIIVRRDSSQGEKSEESEPLGDARPVEGNPAKMNLGSLELEARHMNAIRKVEEVLRDE